jgi:hypothetical protein
LLTHRGHSQQAPGVASGYLLAKCRPFISGDACMSSITGVASSYIPAVSTQSPAAPPPAKTATDADGDKDGTTSATSNSDHAVDIKT